MIEISFKFFGEAQFRRGIAKYSLAGKDLRPVWDAIHKDFLRIEKEAFAGSGARSGFKRWRKLAPHTISYKTRRGFSPLPMEATGRLRRSLTEGGPDHIFVSRPHEVIVGTRVPYAKFHQKRTGSAVGQYSVIQRVTPKQRIWLGLNLGLWKEVGSELRLPRRYIVRLSKADKHRWLQYIHRWFEAQAGRTTWPY